VETIQWILGFFNYLNKRPDLGEMFVEQKIRPLIFSTTLV